MIRTCLFFLCLCLLPLLMFSSTFTSPNSIELPTVAPRLIRDADGKAVTIRTSYRIVSTFRGAAGGDVYLGPSPNSTGPCDDGVFRYNSDVGPSGMPIKFIKFDNSGSRIFENHDINIYFDIVTTKLCVIYRNWKVGDYDVSLGARLLETGGTTSQQDSSWFKIVKDLTTTRTYNLYYCPGPFACPSCPIDECQAVGQVFQDGKRRLALVKDRPLGWAFQKVEELPAATMF